jgi:hypothetical protein
MKWAVDALIDTKIAYRQRDTFYDETTGLGLDSTQNKL